MDKKNSLRLRKLQGVGDVVLEKLRQRVDSLEPLEMNPQMLKHMTGVMKDLKDILTATGEEQAGGITVVFTGELEDYSG
jgi:NAD-dependent DNA ligase